MGTGYLIINGYCDNIAQPVKDAHIVIKKGDRIIKEVLTDASGKSEKISLDCPDKKYSLTPQTEVRPYESYTVMADREELSTVVVEGVEILDGTTSILDIYLKSEPERNSIEEYITIDSPVLWGDYPPKIINQPDSGLPLPNQSDILTRPLVPEYVVVHDGLPSDTSAANYLVRFPDYIKNVASSEIYPTWNTEAIRANVYAILSFTMNRIYSEWYRARGYVFTITSSTQFDQKYIHGRNIFVEISNVVDQIFYQYIQRVNKPFPMFAQYNDGRLVNNPGWLSQWGSQELAARGYVAINILKHYYGSDIFLQTAEEIAGMPSSFPGFNLTLGICSEAVQRIQIQLNTIASTYSNIPRVATDGQYGANTKTAVEIFQRTFSMAVTGIVDYGTWYQISAVYIGVTNMLKARYNETYEI